MSRKGRLNEGHKRVLLMIIMDLKPYSDVNKGGLLQLIKFLQPKFELGSDKLYREMMQDAYGRCRESMQKKIKDDNPEQISIVLDGWSSTHHGYVGVNVHYIQCSRCDPVGDYVTWPRITLQKIH